MHNRLTLRNGRLADGTAADIVIENGSISSVSAAAGTVAGDSSVDLADWVAGPPHRTGAVDLMGRLVLPSLVNGHAHLDKTFVGSGWQPHRSGESVRARVQAERAIRGELVASTTQRAAALAHEMVRFGTGTVRTHVDIDDEVGLESLEVLLELRRTLADRLRMQIVAFPQSGIVSTPGVAGLLDQALAAGADVVGGLDPVGFDGDPVSHLDTVFDLADRHGVGVDIHLHDLGAAAVAQYEMICDRTRATGLAGRVVISHAYGMGSIERDEARRIGATLAGAGVALMTNGPAGPMPPVLAMRDEGVTVFSGSDNIRDAWWPYGTGDMLDVARTVAYQSNFRADHHLEIALDMVTHAAAAGIGLPHYGIAAGNPADLLVVDSPAAAAAVAAPPEWRCVLHAGEVVATSRTLVSRPGSRAAAPQAFAAAASS